jgi:hypothetical protein
MDRNYRQILQKIINLKQGFEIGASNLDKLFSVDIQSTEYFNNLRHQSSVPIF